MLETICQQPIYLIMWQVIVEVKIAHGLTMFHRAAYDSSVAFRGSFRYAAAKCWNNIPPPIRNLQSIYCFIAKLIAYILEQQKKFSSSERFFFIPLCIHFYYSFHLFRTRLIKWLILHLNSDLKNNLNPFESVIVSRFRAR